MPYIKPADRYELEALVTKLRDTPKMTAGQLNYLVTVLANKFVVDHGGNYDAHNAVVGVLTCAQLEFYRRKTVSYEEQKIKENGDV